MNREECLFMTQISEQTERFDDMLKYIKKVIFLNSNLSQDERNLFSFAAKTAVGSRRATWRALSTIEQK